MICTQPVLGKPEANPVAEVRLIHATECEHKWLVCFTHTILAFVGERLCFSGMRMRRQIPWFLFEPGKLDHITTRCGRGGVYSTFGHILDMYMSHQYLMICGLTSRKQQVGAQRLSLVLNLIWRRDRICEMPKITFEFGSYPREKTGSKMWPQKNVISCETTLVPLRPLFF
jgi:hypothetical protein